MFWRFVSDWLVCVSVIRGQSITIMQTSATSCSCSRFARPEARRSAPYVSQRPCAAPLTPVSKSGAVQLRCNAVHSIQRYLLHTLLSCDSASHQLEHCTFTGRLGVSTLWTVGPDRCQRHAGGAGSHSRFAQPQAQNLWIPTPTSGSRRQAKLRANVLRWILVLELCFAFSTAPKREPSDSAHLVPCFRRYPLARS